MATVDVPPSYAEAVALLDRWRAQPPAEVEVNSFLEKAIEALGDPIAIEDFKMTYQDLANAAVSTDNTFYQVNKTLGEFAVEYQSSFPELTDYHVRWQGYHTRWITNLEQSRDLASATSFSYREYDAILRFVEVVETEQDVKHAIKVLRDFSTGRPPVRIPDDLAQQFLDLQRDVEAYQGTFSKYLEEKGAEVTAKIARLKRELEDLQVELDNLNKQVDNARFALEIASVFWLIGAIVGGTILAILTRKRNSKADEVDAKQAEYKKANEEQKALEYLTTTFDALNQSFKVLSSSLSLFANMWQDFHVESDKFADTLEELPDTKTPKQFKLRVKLAREISVPLRESLDLYVKTIERHNVTVKAERKE